jgi:hypothetical protein
VLTHDGEEVLQPLGGPSGHCRHRAFGDWCAEQLGQCLRGALLRQKLPDVEVEDDGGDPWPYCTAASPPRGPRRRS